MKPIFCFLIYYFILLTTLSNQQNENINETNIEAEENSTNNDTNAYSSDDEYCLPPVEEYNETAPLETESEDVATARDYNVSVYKPVSITPKNKYMKDAQIQLMKIHNFHFPSPKKMKFDIFLYFFGKQFAKFIVLRARITYFNRLRNLQEMSAESVRVDCRISQDYSYLLEDELYGIQGEIINFLIVNQIQQQIQG